MAQNGSWRGPFDGYASGRVTEREAAMERRTIVFALIAGLVSCGAAALLAAQSPAPAPPAVAAGPPPCTAPEYRQFDFWVGHWDVKDPSGSTVGTNRITREYGHCVLQEHWEARGPRKQIGSSFNTYSPTLKTWHQTWVDSTGGFLLLDGTFAEGKMVPRGAMPDRTGAER